MKWTFAVFLSGTVVINSGNRFFNICFCNRAISSIYLNYTDAILHVSSSLFLRVCLIEWPYIWQNYGLLESIFKTCFINGDLNVFFCPSIEHTLGGINEIKYLLFASNFGKFFIWYKRNNRDDTQQSSTKVVSISLSFVMNKFEHILQK